MMNYRSLTGVALLCSALSTPHSALAEEVAWRTDYAAARRQAADKGRPLVVVFGSEGCTYCKQMDATTYREAAVVRLLNEQFVPLKLDGLRDGANLAEALKVTTYPTLVFAAPDGRVLGKVVGYQDAAQLEQHLQGVLGQAKPPADKAEAGRAARELLARAKEDFRGRQYAVCLSRCEALAARHPDAPEAAEALRLAAEIKHNCEWLRQSCDALGDQLGAAYLALAEAWVGQGQPQQAVLCLERVIRTLPGSRHAEEAQVRLAQIQGQPVRPLEKK